MSRTQPFASSLSATRNSRKARATTGNGHDKQSEIFAAAVRIFERKGYHAASMQDLADAVGMQKASLYYYISSKEDLLLAVCERGTDALTEQLTELSAAPLSPTEKLRRAIEAHLLALCEQLELFKVYLREQKFYNGRQKTRVRAEGERHATLLEAILEEGVRAGEFRAINIKMTTYAIIGMCNWLYQWYSPDGPLTPREIANIFSDLIIQGLSKPARSAHKSRVTSGRNGSARRGKEKRRT